MQFNSLSKRLACWNFCFGPKRGQPALHTAGVRLPPCRVTNEGQEMIEKELYDKFPEDMIDLGVQYQIPHPERGPLERRVATTYEEALFDEGIVPEEAEYWFTTPEGGWDQERKQIKKAPVVPNETPVAYHIDGEGRIPIETLYEGQELWGTVNRVMLLHGVQVDFGADFDGLIPVSEAQFMELWPWLEVDNKVKVRIARIIDSGLCRFPIICEVLVPAIQHKLNPPEDHEPRWDMRGVPDLDELIKQTGRPYTPTRYFQQTLPSRQEVRTERLAEEWDFDEDSELLPNRLPPRVRADIANMVASS
ncbi:hypothetical protein WJX72_008389 [[Myrmecia] bisecta]|uniref:S1 motif domain-containing protein n=1 Tax=[Myrmecia] bisecta TaxID=41462 RepID=A0AAW1PTB0_9CHLO